MKSIYAIGLLFLAAEALIAQDAKPEPPPAPPYVAPAPAVSGWTIILQASGSTSANAESRVTKVFKAGNRKLEIVDLPQGAKAETFIVNGTSFQRRPGLAPGDIYVESASRASDFPELSWVSAENFIGTKTEGGRKYHVYAWTPVTLQMDSTGSAKQMAPARTGTQGGKIIEAWIDAETRLPAKLVNPTFLRKYQFAKASPQDAEPSAEIRQKAESYFGGKIPDKG